MLALTGSLLSPFGLGLIVSLVLQIPKRLSLKNKTLKTYLEILAWVRFHLSINLTWCMCQEQMPYKVDVFCARRTIFLILFIIWKLTFFIESICPWEENDSPVFLASKWHYLLLSPFIFYSSALVAEHRKQSGNLRGCSEIFSLSSGHQVI